MPKCTQCGVELPLSGECPRCAPKPAQTPSLLTRELNLDRRREPTAPPPVPTRAPPASSQPAPPRPPAPAAARPSPTAARPQPSGPQPQAPAQRPPPAPNRAIPQSPPPLSGQAAPAPARPSPAPGTARPAPPIAAPVAARPAPPNAAPAVARPAPPVAAPAVARPAPPSPEPVSSPPPPAIAADPATSEVPAQPASLWRRLLAFSIDAVVVLGVWWLFLLAASAVIGVQPQPSHLTGIDALMLELHAYQPVMVPGAVLGILLAGSYCAAFAFLRQGRTLGRWALGLRLVDARGSAPTPVRAVVRAALAVVSFALFLVGFWVALFDRRGQTLHDKLTATFVIRPL